MTSSTFEPLVNSVEVNCSQADAFDLWTSRPTTWWPMNEHTTFGQDAIAIVIEPGINGKIYELNTSGMMQDWGQITGWDPPSGMAFAWHIYGTADEATDVTVSFDRVEEDRTRVTIVHSGWERLADRAQQLREGNQVGWTHLLEAFSTAINRQFSNR